MDALKKLESHRLFDAYVLSNTIGPGLKIDVKTRTPALGSIFGGLSGAAIKPLVLARIYDLKQQTDKPVVGVGGIETSDDALEYIILGCSAVQVYTAAHRRGLGIFSEMNSGLEASLKSMRETVGSIRGTLRVQPRA
jgi:dihydroorotate dehydrogenase (NAD+) catalytic subunit